MNDVRKVITASQNKWNNLAEEDIYKAIWCSRGEVTSDWDEATIQCLEVILKSIPIQPEWKVLDLGCGIGRLTKPMAAKCSEIIGVDFSVEMIEQAKKYLTSVCNVRLVQNNGMDLSLFEDSYFDFVYSMITFQHIPSLAIVENYVSEVARILKSGGYAKLQTCDGDSFASGMISPTLYHGHISKYCFQRILNQANLSIIMIEMGLIRNDWIWATVKKD